MTDDEGPIVLILGAGINGAALARELLLARVGVCLVDTADISSGTTAYSSRLIHGGLRYLEFAEFSLVRESLAERTRLLSQAPQYVRPLQLAIPLRTRAGGLMSGLKRFIGFSAAAQARGLWTVRAGLTMYDLLARDRQLPKHRLRSIDDVQRPRVDAVGVRWACYYWDAQIVYPERFVLALLEDARQLAAQSGSAFHVLPYHRATLENRTARIYRVDNGDEPVLGFSPAAVVNATGAWVDETLSRLKVSSGRLMGGTKGSHFVTFNESLSRSLGGCGVYAEAADGRPVFILPLATPTEAGDPPATLIGTTDEPYTGDPADATATPAELEYLLNTANQVIPGIDLREDDIDMHYCGVRPLPFTDESTPAAITRRHWIVEHPDCPLPMISLVGGKLTTCRSLAEEAAASVMQRLQMTSAATSRDRVIPGGASYPADAKELQATWNELIDRFAITSAQVAAIWPLLGTRAGEVLQSVGGAPGGNLAGTQLPRAVVRWIIDYEWVTTLNDLVERRLMLLFHPRLSRACLRDLAALLTETGRTENANQEESVSQTAAYLKQRYGKQVRDD